MSEQKSVAVADSAVAALMEQFQSGAKFTSVNGLVSTAKQTKQTGKYFKSYQKVKNKSANLLIIADITFGFDPFSGKETEQYNPITEFRSQGSARAMMFALKKIYSDNIEVYAGGINRLRRESGVSDWDPTVDPDTLNAKDLEVFKHYLKPKTFTMPVCSVNIPAITGLKWGKEYLVNVERDPETDNIIGEVPVILQLGQLQTDFYGKKYHQWEEARKAQAASGIAKELTDDEKKEKMKEIFANITVSKDFPSNRTLAFELPLNKSQDIEYADLLSLNPQEFFSQLCLLKENKKVKEELQNFGTPARAKYISSSGFFHLKVESGNADDPAQLGQATKYGTPSDNSIVYPQSDQERENAALIIDHICDILDENAKDLEKIFMRSVKILPFDETLDSKLIKSVESSIDWKDESIVDEAFVLKHAKILQLMSSQEVIDLLDKYGLSTMVVDKINILTPDEEQLVTATTVEVHDEETGQSALNDTQSLEASINAQKLKDEQGKGQADGSGGIMTTFN